MNISKEKISRPELLAPAGSPSAALAALEYGADAIYLGLKRFSARAEAENFSHDELNQIVSYAHSFAPRRRVFVALNTLIKDQELDAIVRTLQELVNLEVDAIIVQDWAIANLCRRYFPQLRLHASTQLAVHNLAGVEALASFGFHRVTMARELTITEIDHIARSTKIEIEAFVHGALCYAYSGLCLFSSHVSGRSGNRGRCSYPCREDWRVQAFHSKDASKLACKTDHGFIYSMKDLALGEAALAYTAARVSSLKIEGRKKSPLYVAAAVAYYRGLIDGTLSPTELAEREADLRSIFSRPLTSLYAHARDNLDVTDISVVGHRGTPIGEIKAISRDGRRHLMRFETSRALGIHDGLQLDFTGVDGRPFGFGISELYYCFQAKTSGRISKKQVVEVDAQSMVEVLLPEKHPNLPIGATVYCSSSSRVKKRYQLASVNIKTYQKKRNLELTVEVDKEGLHLTGQTPAARGLDEVQAKVFLPLALEVAKEASALAVSAQAALGKLGDSAFMLTFFSYHNPDLWFVPVSKWNEARRMLIKALDAAFQEAEKIRVEAVLSDLVPTALPAKVDNQAPLWSIKVDRIAMLEAFNLEDLAGLEEVIIDISRDCRDDLLSGLKRLNDLSGQVRIRLALPVIMRAFDEEELLPKLQRLRGLDYTRWEITNAYGFHLLAETQKAAALDISADYSLNVLNRGAARFLLEQGISGFALSVEDDASNMQRILAEFSNEATVIVYQDSPLYIAETCPYRSLSGQCAGPMNCRYKSMEMTSFHGMKVITYRDRCRAITIQNTPFALAHEFSNLREMGVKKLRADFIWRDYSSAQVLAILNSLRSGNVDFEFHRGNFLRGLL